MLDFLHLDHVSYFGITLVLILTGSGLPIPEEVPIVAAGIASSVGTLNPWGAFAACLVGALVGDAVIYGIGYHFGHSLVNRHPRFAHLLHAEREAKMEDMIRRHGFKVIFLSRFMVGIRAPVYLTAGILRMPFRRFVLTDAVCATTVVSLFFGLSYAYGDRLTLWLQRSELGFTVIVVIAVAAVALYFLIKHQRNKRLAALEAEAPREETCGVGAPASKEVPH